MAYAQRKRSPSRGSTSDPRYSTRRWTELALRVRRRDGRCMVVPGCERGAQLADHIVPVTPDMPDWQFYSESNLRAACRRCNNLRGMETTVQRELHGVTSVVRSRYSIGSPRPAVRRRGASEHGRSLGASETHDVRLAALYTQSRVVRTDYTATTAPAPAGATERLDAG